jgi:uncharacterized protein (TIGR00730 family)
MKVSVFGGSQPQKGDSAYAEAYLLGKMLAEAGHTVMTGGYIGTMEAVSHGASKAGGHVIGVTCDEIENWRPVRPNEWVQEEWRRSTLMERLQALVQECDAAMALPGGLGTLTEISLTWNLMIVGAMHRRPLVLIGDGWQTVIDQVLRSFEIYIPDIQQELVQFSPDVKSAIRFLDHI